MKNLLKSIAFIIATILAIAFVFTGCSGSGSTDKSALVVIDVYAGGYSVNSSGVTVPGYWENGVWHGLTPLDTTKYATVNSIVVVVQ